MVNLTSYFSTELFWTKQCTFMHSADNSNIWSLSHGHTLGAFEK